MNTQSSAHKSNKIDKFGQIYCMKNQSFNYKKIGLTQKQLKRREKQLSNTSVPFPFKTILSKLVKHPRKSESTIHANLAFYRIKKEHFQCPLTKIKIQFDLIEEFSIIGKYIEKQFGEKMYYGIIKNKYELDGETLWQIVYHDGDKEDLTTDECCQYQCSYEPTRYFKNKIGLFL